MTKIISPFVLKMATVGLTICAGFVQPSLADQTTLQTVIGSVNDVEVLTTTYVRKIPIDEKICNTRDVPVYSEEKGGSELSGLIVGGLIGSAVGNAVTDADGAGTFGAVTGALLGREHNKNARRQGEIIGYRQQEFCETQKTIREERVEEITGYRLNVSVDDQDIILKTKQSYNPGDEIKIRRKVTYSVN
jgi:uncharacterized protein YcfJ